MLLYVTLLIIMVEISKEKKATGISLFTRGEARQSFPCDNLLEDNLNQVKVQESPLFNFEKLATATNNFHLSNKLGQGGFGLVYRVMVALLEVSCQIISITS